MDVDVSDRNLRELALIGVLLIFVIGGYFEIRDARQNSISRYGHDRHEAPLRIGGYAVLLFAFAILAVFLLNTWFGVSFYW